MQAMERKKKSREEMKRKAGGKKRGVETEGITKERVSKKAREKKEKKIGWRKAMAVKERYTFSLFYYCSPNTRPKSRSR